MKFKFTALLLFVCIVFSAQNTFAEGTKQVRPLESNAGSLTVDAGYSGFATTNATENYRLYINIEAVNETILFGFKPEYPNVSYNLYDPYGAIVKTGIIPNTNNTTGHIDSYPQAYEGPFPAPIGTGYLPFSYQVTDPAKLGNYYIAFSGSNILFSLFDITVVSGANNPALPADVRNGRVWSQAWQFNAPIDGDFSGRFYIYSDDGIVTKLNYDHCGVGTFKMYCNAVGCTNGSNPSDNRKSKNVNTSSTFQAIAQYKVFLNDPDTTFCPSGIFGQFNTPPIWPRIRLFHCAAEKK